MVAIVAFVALGTVSGVWTNPFFVRMTPTGSWELPALSLLAALTGVFVAIPSACGLRRATAGGTASFVGIACPTCNKILMLVFGGEALMAGFDPVRPYVAAAGIALLSFAIWRKWRSTRFSKTRSTNKASL
jgi:threonine/homoserine/homoserine lactone efflux protein